MNFKQAPQCRAVGAFPTGLLFRPGGMGDPSWLRMMAHRLACGAWVIGLTGLLGSPPSGVHAAPIFSQTLVVDSGQQSDREGFQRSANEFTLSSNDTVRSVIWRGLYSMGGTPQAVDDFNINFHADSAGLPGALLQSFAVGNAVNRIDTGIVLFGCCSIFEYTADLGTGIALTAGPTFHVSISNDTTVDGNDDWFWALRVLSGSNSVSIDSGATWNIDLQETYFILDNANSSAPEPSIALFLGLSIAGAAALRRRNRLT